MNTDVAAVLRTHPEPCRRVSNDEVHGALTEDPADYARFVERALRRVAEGEIGVERPPKAVFDDGPSAGDFRVMPCVVRGDGRVTKTVKVVGTNVTETVVPDQVTVGRALRLHPDDNFVTHLLDACLLSSARTGACALTALRALAPSARRLGVVGAGRVAYYTILCAAAATDVEEIAVTDRDRDRARTLCSTLAPETGGTHLRATDLEAAAGGDALVLATTSRTPVVRPRDVGARVVVSLGADTDDQRELHEAWREEARIHVDALDSLRTGDLRAWSAGRELTEEDVGDLAALLRRRSPPGGRQVFISTGSALLDNLTVRYLEVRGRLPGEG